MVCGSVGSVAPNPADDKRGSGTARWGAARVFTTSG